MIEKNTAYSHLNLGPTVLDLAGLNVKHDFIADSVFSKKEKKEKIYLVQPYSGGVYSVIDWPNKYIFSEYSEEEWIYNLEQDPQERQPLALDKNPVLLSQLRLEAAQIYKQQDIFECKSARAIDLTSTPHEYKLTPDPWPIQRLQSQR